MDKRIGYKHRNRRKKEELSVLQTLKLLPKCISRSRIKHNRYDYKSITFYRYQNFRFIKFKDVPCEWCITLWLSTKGFT